MNSNAPTLLLVIADGVLTQELIAHLVSGQAAAQVPIATSLALARSRVVHTAPAVILFDESALAPPDSLHDAVADLSRFAPVVVLADPQWQPEIAPLAATGAADFVARLGNFVPLAISLLERRARIAQPPRMRDPLTWEPAMEFAEILRHEMNNPLTGILGNAELLLAHRDQLLPADLRRLETIAELAVRLREAVRRLSYSWDNKRQDAARLTSP